MAKFKFKPDSDVDDSGRTNGERADLGEAALAAYGLLYHTPARKIEDDEREEVTQDLFTDLMHLCDKHKLDVDDVIRRARANHIAER